MSSAYSFAGGSLRLKKDGASSIESGKVSKKHKHKKSKSKSSDTVEAPSSKMEHVTSTISTNDSHGASGSGSSRRDPRTPSEIAYDEAMAKREQEKIMKKAVKSHKERVEDLNSYLDKLTEYNDIPKVSWTK